MGTHPFLATCCLCLCLLGIVITAHADTTGYSGSLTITGGETVTLSGGSASVSYDPALKVARIVLGDVEEWSGETFDGIVLVVPSEDGTSVAAGEYEGVLCVGKAFTSYNAGCANFVRYVNGEGQGVFGTGGGTISLTTSGGSISGSVSNIQFIGSLDGATLVEGVLSAEFTKAQSGPAPSPTAEARFGLLECKGLDVTAANALRADVSAGTSAACTSAGVQLTPNTYACAGDWSGRVSGASAAALCRAGWSVCTSKESKSHLGFLKASQTGLATAGNILPGCYALDAAHDNGKCGNCVGTSKNNDDMAGFGAGCPFRSAKSGCFSGGRIDTACCSDHESGSACSAKPGVTTGVLCCRDTLVESEEDDD